MNCELLTYQEHEYNEQEAITAYSIPAWLFSTNAQLRQNLLLFYDNATPLQTILPGLLPISSCTISANGE